MLQPAVSIVIPVYNADEYISDCIESVLQQDIAHHALELIVVDDGSTDSSVSVIEGLLDRCNFYTNLLRTKNGGPSRARNLGWQHAKGRWIQFLDADDLLMPTKIRQQLVDAESLPDTIAVVYSPWQRLYHLTSHSQMESTLVDPCIGVDSLADLLKTENFIATGSQLFRRDWLEHDDGFDERFRLIEDVHLLLRLAMAGGRFHKVESSTPLFCYRQRPGASLSQQDMDAFMEGCIRNAMLVESYCTELGKMTPEQRQGIISVYFQVARYYADKDEAKFDQAVQRLDRFQPGLLPDKPFHLRQLSRLVGYRRAERVAVGWRSWKHLNARRKIRQSGQ